jgi:hypothetical protein
MKTRTIALSLALLVTGAIAAIDMASNPFLRAITTVLVIMWLYLVPAVIADLRKHHNRWAIFWTNLFLGWTFLGWVGAFIWACTNPPTATTNPALATR